MPGSSDLSALARAAQGIPSGAPGAPAPGAAGGTDILAALKNGQISAEALLQLISMLISGGAPPQASAPSQEGSPLQAAFLGQ
jgi:hypothetical protein